MYSLIITTSREPSRRTRSFVNDLVKVVPNSIRFNRGKATYEDLATIAKRYSSRGVLMILEKKGNPSALAYLIPESITSLTRRYVVLISSLRLLREIKDHQTPYNVRKLVLNFSKVPQGFPQRVCEALIEIFAPTLVQAPEESPDVVELKVAGDENSVFVTFYCSSTGRICGPAFSVLRIHSYSAGNRV